MPVFVLLLACQENPPASDTSDSPPASSLTVSAVTGPLRIPDNTTPDPPGDLDGVTVEISPQAPRWDTDLHCVVNGPTADDLTISWEAEGDHQPPMADGVRVGDTVPHLKQAGGQQWVCVVRSPSGAEARSAPVRIEPPVPMIAVAGGTFSGLDGFESAVTLTRTYLLGQFEVSRREWALWMPEAGPDAAVVDDDSPATYISWYDMLYFANLLSVADGLEPCARCSVVQGENHCEVRPDPYACEGYRLSTKAEWTFACFEGGRHADDCPAGGVPRVSDIGGPEPLVGPDAPPNAVFSDYCHNRNETRTYLPVRAAKLPNALGFFGMCGNGQDATLDSAGLSEFNHLVTLTDPYLHDAFDGTYSILGGSIDSSTPMSGCNGVSVMIFDNNRNKQTLRLARTLTAPRHP